MGFKLVICPPNYQDDWPGKLKEAIPDIEVHLCPTVGEAMEVIGDADAAFGDIVPELFEQAGNLKWVACPQAGPRAGYYHEALINSDIVVTNTREIYNDHISAHIMALLLAFARGSRSTSLSRSRVSGVRGTTRYTFPRPLRWSLGSGASEGRLPGCARNLA